MPDASSWRPSLTFSRWSLHKVEKTINSQNSEQQPDNADEDDNKADILRSEAVVGSDSEYDNNNGANLPICTDEIRPPQCNNGYSAPRVWKQRGIRRGHSDQQPNHLDAASNVGGAKNDESMSEFDYQHMIADNSCTELQDCCDADIARLTESRSKPKGPNAWKPHLTESIGLHITRSSHAKEDSLQTAVIGEPGCSRQGSARGTAKQEKQQRHTVQAACLGSNDVPRKEVVRVKASRSGAIGAYQKAKQAQVGATPLDCPSQVDEYASQVHKGRVQSDTVGTCRKAKRNPVGAKPLAHPTQADRCLSHSKPEMDRVKFNKNSMLSEKEACQTKGMKNSMQSVSRIKVADSEEDDDGAVQVEVQKILEQACSDSDGMSAPAGPADLEHEDVRHEGAHATSTEVEAKAVIVDNATSKKANLFSNTCALCGASRLLVIDCGAEFVCEEAGERCRIAKQKAKVSKAEEFPPLPSQPQADACALLPVSNHTAQSSCFNREQAVRTKPYKNNLHFTKESKESGSRTGLAVSRVDAGSAEVHTHQLFRPPRSSQAGLVSLQQPGEVCVPSGGSDGMWDLSNLSAGLEDAEVHEEEVNEEAGFTQCIPPQDDAILLKSEVTHEESELFLNTCALCGETRLFVIDFGEEFVCEEAGESCTSAVVDSTVNKDRHGGRWADEDVEDKNDDTVEEMSLRVRLLQEVLAKNLTMLETADLFLRQGEQPPSELELKAQLEHVQQRAREQKVRQQSRVKNAAWRAAQKKRQRYRDGELVEVQRGSKYLVSAKESAAEKAKTSVSIVIQGARRIMTSDKEKKGPRS